MNFQTDWRWCAAIVPGDPEIAPPPFFRSEALGELMTKSEIIALLKYDAWAIGTMLTSIEKLNTAQFEQNMKSSHSGIQGTMSHIYGVQRMWLARWTGKGENALPSVLLSQAEMRERWNVLHVELLAFVATLSDEKVLASFMYKDLRGTPYLQPLWQQFQHMVNHSSYYRGQVTIMLRQCGVVPAQTDLIAYYRAH